LGIDFDTLLGMLGLVVLIVLLELVVLLELCLVVWPVESCFLIEILSLLSVFLKKRSCYWSWLACIVLLPDIFL